MVGPLSPPCCPPQRLLNSPQRQLAPTHASGTREMEIQALLMRCSSNFSDWVSSACAGPLLLDAAALRLVVACGAWPCSSSSLAGYS
ncbi:hypothetical protein TIFTF001_020469 [Ficus carica]|uniref:Uncharacterized protein n=1 Tax=Ficus carica TaxID=3494 RepID=A0AA88AF00_FICCA|nr:hypothetical protein TIFTF001_020469 [Ficus carica]